MYINKLTYKLTITLRSENRLWLKVRSHLLMFLLQVRILKHKSNLLLVAGIYCWRYWFLSFFWLLLLVLLWELSSSKKNLWSQELFQLTIYQTLMRQWKLINGYTKNQIFSVLQNKSKDKLWLFIRNNKMEDYFLNHLYLLIMLKIWNYHQVISSKMTKKLVLLLNMLDKIVFYFRSIPIKTSFTMINITLKQPKDCLLSHLLEDLRRKILRTKMLSMSISDLSMRHMRWYDGSVERFNRCDSCSKFQRYR